MSKKKPVKLFRPKSFRLLNQKWKIKYVKDLFATHAAYGLCVYDIHTIFIQIPTGNIVLNETQIKSTIAHEVIHSMLRAMGREDLNTNEPLVDLCGAMVCQIGESLK